MVIIEGKKYIRRDGIITAELSIYDSCGQLFFWDQKCGISVYHPNGNYWFDRAESDYDIISEYKEG